MPCSLLDEQRMTSQFWKLLSLHGRQVAFSGPSGLGRTSVCGRSPNLYAIIAADESRSHCIQEVHSPPANFTKLWKHFSCYFKCKQHMFQIDDFIRNHWKTITNTECRLWTPSEIALQPARYICHNERIWEHIVIMYMARFAVYAIHRFYAFKKCALL